MALPTQWSFAEQAAEQHGQTVDRADWRVLMSWHLAETRDQAIQESALGLQRWHNDYNVKVLGRPGAEPMSDAYAAAEAIANGDPTSGAGAGIIGTPDDAIERIRALRDIVGGFGVVLGFAHDWANREATLRSWELFARYVVPEINGYIRPMRDSADYVTSNKDALMAGAVGAIMEAIGKHKGATEAAAETARLIANAGPPSPVR
jgi:limonene 1,2-monooxygenase